MSKCDNLQGSSVIVKIKEEAEFGVAEDTGFKKIYIKSDSVNYSQNQVESELLTSGRSETKSAKGNVEVGGAIEVAVDNKQFGFWLKMLLGKVSTVADGAKFKHIFNISDGCLPSFQKEKTLSNGLINYKAVGLKADKLNIDFGGEGEIIASVDILGKDEYEVLHQADSLIKGLAIDANINSKTLTLDSTTGVEVGDSLTILINETTVSVASNSGNSTVYVNDASSFAEFDNVLISGEYYKVKTISGNILLLNKSLTKDVSSGEVVYKAKNQNIINEVNGNDVVLENGINQNITTNDTIILIGSTSSLFNGETFNNFSLDIVSVDGLEITAVVETFKLNFENGAEAKRLLKDKGKVGKILEGTAKVKLELNLILDIASAKFIEDAKVEKEFDITLTAFNSSGDSLKFIMPKGTLTPITPEISSPTAVEVSVEYKPFKTDTNESITVELINDETGY